MARLDFLLVGALAVPAVALAPDGVTAQGAPTQGPPQLRSFASTGLPVVYPFHGTILNHDLTEVPATAENIRRLVTLFLDGVSRKVGGGAAASTDSLRARVREQAGGADAEALLQMRVAAALIENLDPSERAQYVSMLRVIETWAASNTRSNRISVTRADPGFAARARTLGFEAQRSPARADGATSYIQQCRDAKVPIPPDWGSPEWKYQGELDKKYDFVRSGNRQTEVWAYPGREPKGVCLALPRYTKIDNEIVLTVLGIICQSKETGKACFWDNLPRDSVERITGEAVKTMRISDIQDGSMLDENCTNCHRGHNVFLIHPGTALDLEHTFDIHPDRRYEPISGQANWGNPPPLIKQGEAPCGSCHEIPALRDGNNTSTTQSSYCATVLAQASKLTMPYLGSPAGWESPKPAYESHIRALKQQCDTETVAQAQ
jgi:hypothetical protein